MLIPLITLGAVEYRSADRQVQTTGRIEAEATELATLIRLSGAVMDEAIASTLVELLPELGFSTESLALLGDHAPLAAGHRDEVRVGARHVEVVHRDRAARPAPDAFTP